MCMFNEDDDDDDSDHEEEDEEEEEEQENEEEEEEEQDTNGFSRPNSNTNVGGTGKLTVNVHGYYTDDNNKDGGGGGGGGNVDNDDEYIVQKLPALFMNFDRDDFSKNAKKQRKMPTRKPRQRIADIEPPGYGPWWVFMLVNVVSGDDTKKQTEVRLDTYPELVAVIKVQKKICNRSHVNNFFLVEQCFARGLGHCAIAWSVLQLEHGIACATSVGKRNSWSGVAHRSRTGVVVQVQKRRNLHACQRSLQTGVAGFFSACTREERACTSRRNSTREKAKRGRVSCNNVV